jgi:hypothetical protein
MIRTVAKGVEIGRSFGAIEAIAKGHENYSSDVTPESRNCSLLINGSVNRFPRK